MSQPVLPWSYQPNRPYVGAPDTNQLNNPDKQVSDAPVPALFKPIKLRELTLKNRIVVSPMCTYSAKDGVIGDFHVAHLGQFAIGGAALIIEEASAVQPNGRISPYDVGLWSDSQIANQKRVVDVIHSQHAAAGIQLAHAGRKASTPPPFPDFAKKFYMTAEEGGWPDQVVGPSAIPWNEGWLVPRELTVPEIHEIQQAYVAATRRAEKAGFDYVEIHAAHGYLFHSFYSPHSNHRTDEYGGSFENRVRFLVETAKLVREAWPAHKPLAVRLSCSDWLDTDESWEIEQTVKLVNLLIEAGVDIVDTSSGGNSPHQKFGPILGEIKDDYQTQFGARVKQEYKDRIFVGPVGRIRTGPVANELIESGKADFIHVGRQFLRDPHFARTAAKELNHEIWLAPQYEWSVGTAHGGVNRRR